MSIVAEFSLPVGYWQIKSPRGIVHATNSACRYPNGTLCNPDPGMNTTEDEDWVDTDEEVTCQHCLAILAKM